MRLLEEIEKSCLTNNDAARLQSGQDGADTISVSENPKKKTDRRNELKGHIDMMSSLGDSMMNPPHPPSILIY